MEWSIEETQIQDEEEWYLHFAEKSLGGYWSTTWTWVNNVKSKHLPNMSKHEYSVWNAKENLFGLYAHFKICLRRATSIAIGLENNDLQWKIKYINPVYLKKRRSGNRKHISNFQILKKYLGRGGEYSMQKATEIMGPKTQKSKRGY